MRGKGKPLFAEPILRVGRKRADPARAYGHRDLGHDAMIYWLARAAKEERLKRGRKQVHIAATIDKDQSTVNRFEQGEHWPRDVDELLAGYAEDLDINAQDLWAKALKMWRESGNSGAPT
jgi:hypothetical protein